MSPYWSNAASLANNGGTGTGSILAPGIGPVIGFFTWHVECRVSATVIEYMVGGSGGLLRLAMFNADGSVRIMNLLDAVPISPGLVRRGLATGIYALDPGLYWIAMYTGQDLEVVTMVAGEDSHPLPEQQPNVYRGYLDIPSGVIPATFNIGDLQQFPGTITPLVLLR